MLKLHYLIFFLQNVHGNAEIMADLIEIDCIAFFLNKKSTTFFDNPCIYNLSSLWA